jgi:hypothetical protein
VGYSEVYLFISRIGLSLFTIIDLDGLTSRVWSPKKFFLSFGSDFSPPAAKISL